MSDIQRTEVPRRIDVTHRMEVTNREAQRREIAAQVEMFLEHGGRIDVLNSPRFEAGAPIGRVWWDVPETAARL
jgi:hypothetical protein